MPLNIPSGSTNDISFGPGVLYLGVAGTTPTVDVGYISEDGISVEIASEKKEIRQGNPSLVEYVFSTTQDVTVSLTSIEWDFENFALALAAGVTTSSGSAKTLSWGGDPLVDAVAIHVQHQMAVTGNTMNCYIWKAFSETGITLPLGMEEHAFELTFKAMRSATDWSGASLPSSQQLIKLSRAL
jgi:hypothetical protein